MSTEQASRPTPGQVEERQAPALEADGRRIRGRIPYGVESRDLGGWREVIEAGALNRADLGDLVATVDHVGLPLGRYPSTLQIEDRSDGMHWSVDPPASRADVREAIERGDLRGGSWRMIVGRDEWRGDVRHVHESKALRDVALVTTGAYPADAAAVELRSQEPNKAQPAEEVTTMAEQAEQTTQQTETAEQPVEDRSQPTAGALQVEQRQETTETRSYDEIVVASIRDVQVGETRSLASASSPLSPTELSAQLFQSLRASSIALQSGIPVIATDRENIQWPMLNSDVAPAFYSEGGTITPGDPGFTTVTCEPAKIAHIVVASNEVIDDSEPPVVQVLTNHLNTMLGLKLDSAVFVGGTATPGVTGLNNISSTQVGGTITTAGTAGDTSYPELLAGVGLLRKANAPEPYVLACHPDVRAAFESLQDTTGQPVQPPPSTPTFYTSTQINSGTSYLYSPSQLAIVRRQDATVEVDRSRLFNSDESEIRGKMRVGLIAPNPTAIVKLTAGTAA
jgi:HK97 family phage major capsid protein